MSAEYNLAELARREIPQLKLESTEILSNAKLFSNWLPELQYMLNSYLFQHFVKLFNLLGTQQIRL